MRNRIRRRLREAARLADVKAGWDILLIARRDSPRADYHQLKQAMEELLGRANLLHARVSTDAHHIPSEIDRERPRESSDEAHRVEAPALTSGERGVEQ